MALLPADELAQARILAFGAFRLGQPQPQFLVFVPQGLILLAELPGGHHRFAGLAEQTVGRMGQPGQGEEQAPQAQLEPGGHLAWQV